LNKLLIDVIIKRAKQSTLALYDEIQKIKLKLNEPPVDIEKLTEIKQYMANLPLELEKVKEDIDKSCEIYDLLEPFKVRF
jgi:dynein heavy chain